LTGKYYLTLTSALELKMEGNPVGSTSTGKTEKAKNRAKAFARICILLNCLEKLN
jgi:dynein heavy chain